MNSCGDKVNVSGSLYIVGLRPFESPCILVKGSFGLLPGAAMHFESCHNNATENQHEGENWWDYSFLQLKAAEPEDSSGGALGVDGKLIVQGAVNITDCSSNGKGGAVHVQGTVSCPCLLCDYKQYCARSKPEALGRQYPDSGRHLASRGLLRRLGGRLDEFGQTYPLFHRCLVCGLLKLKL